MAKVKNCLSCRWSACPHYSKDKEVCSKYEILPFSEEYLEKAKLDYRRNLNILSKDLRDSIKNGDIDMRFNVFKEVVTVIEISVKNGTIDAQIGDMDLKDFTFHFLEIKQF